MQMLPRRQPAAAAELCTEFTENTLLHKLSPVYRNTLPVLNIHTEFTFTEYQPPNISVKNKEKKWILIYRVPSILMIFDKNSGAVVHPPR